MIRGEKILQKDHRDQRSLLRTNVGTISPIDSMNITTHDRFELVLKNFYLYGIIDKSCLLSHMDTKFLISLEPFPYFSIESIKQLSMVEKIKDSSIRTTVYRWAKAGLVIPLKKGIYVTRRFYERHRGDADFSMMVSAILTPQSYISLEFVLQRNSILTDFTYPVSAVTSKATHVIENSLGTFTYRHVKEPIYGGYSISEYCGIPFGVASVAKSLFDYIYLRNWSNVRRSADFNLAEELRLSLGDFSAAERYEFSEYVRLSRSRKMEWALANLKRSTWRT